MIRSLVRPIGKLKSFRLLPLCWADLKSGPPKPQSRSVVTVSIRLDSWDVDEFRTTAFLPQIPAVLPCASDETIPASMKWFDHITNDGDHKQPKQSELKMSFWEAYAQCIVPLEITTKVPDDASATTFDRVEAPLQLLLSYLDIASRESGDVSRSVYLAQHDLRDLPQLLQHDLPIPELVKHAGKGDLYNSSLWLGRPPTYTPLHRDPNPNLFVQLAGTKIIRLFHPQVGDAIFEHTQRLISNAFNQGSAARSASFRGEEMMKGPERSILHDLIWADPSQSTQNAVILDHAQEAVLGLGQALFIPKGWWHSVKGVGNGVTASANWWFR